MKRTIIINWLTGLIFFIANPLWVKGNDAKPGYKLTCDHFITISSIDTLPPTPKNAGTTQGGTSKEIIKEIPKSRRQQVPMPVTIKVKPIKIIKPKIIKPLIKVLN